MELKEINGHMILPGAITVTVAGKNYHVNSGNKALYDQVKNLIKAGKFAEIPETIDRLSGIVKKVAEAANKNPAAAAKIEVRDRRVYAVFADGTSSRLTGYEVDKLLQLMDEGFDITPLSNFALRVRQNPGEHVRDRLYRFMEVGHLPLLEDGSFLGYKVVRNNYKDKYSGTFDNSVGKRVEMPREQVDDDDNRTCSRGLHVASKDYIRSFRSGSDRLMVVRVAPEDVVSIPTDYNDTKMRTAAYTVIGEITAVDDPAFFGRAVYQPAAVEEPEDAAAVSVSDDDTGVDVHFA